MPCAVPRPVPGGIAQEHHHRRQIRKHLRLEVRIWCHRNRDGRGGGGEEDFLSVNPRSRENGKHVLAGSCRHNRCPTPSGPQRQIVRCPPLKRQLAPTELARDFVHACDFIGVIPVFDASRMGSFHCTRRPGRKRLVPRLRRNPRNQQGYTASSFAAQRRKNFLFAQFGQYIGGDYDRYGLPVMDGLQRSGNIARAGEQNDLLVQPVEAGRGFHLLLSGGVHSGFPT